jgi:hypothetical protein
MFLNMRPYEDRKVARFEKDDLIISTAEMDDGSQPFETGVQHPDYNEGKWVIVEAYATKELAKAGHDRWVGTMTADTLPDALVDCANCVIAQILDPESLTFVRKTL